MMQVPVASLMKCMASRWVDEALMDVGMRAGLMEDDGML
jgi:hypothetical protein